jgi:hypothetical protein
MQMRGQYPCSSSLQSVNESWWDFFVWRRDLRHSPASERSLHFFVEIMVQMGTVAFPYHKTARPKCVVVLRSPKNGLSWNAVTTTFLCGLSPLLQAFTSALGLRLWPGASDVSR